MTGQAVTISVPGENGTLTMENPEWVELAAGWQLGGWVNRDEGYQFSPMYGADRITVTYPTGSPEFITLRGAVSLGTDRGLSRVYLKIPAAGPPVQRGRDAAPVDELTHLPRLDDHGNPTEYALCDTGDGTFPGGLLAVPNAWRANCEACLTWEE